MSYVLTNESATIEELQLLEMTILNNGGPNKQIYRVTLEDISNTDLIEVSREKGTLIITKVKEGIAVDEIDDHGSYVTLTYHKE